MRCTASLEIWPTSSTKQPQTHTRTQKYICFCFCISSLLFIFYKTCQQQQTIAPFFCSFVFPNFFFLNTRICLMDTFKPLFCFLSAPLSLSWSISSLLCDYALGVSARVFPLRPSQLRLRVYWQSHTPCHAADTSLPLSCILVAKSQQRSVRFFMTFPFVFISRVHCAYTRQILRLTPYVVQRHWRSVSTCSRS